MMISFSLLSFHSITVLQTTCSKAVAVYHHCHHIDSILLSLWLCGNEDLTLVCLLWLSYVCYVKFMLFLSWHYLVETVLWWQCVVPLFYVVCLVYFCILYVHSSSIFLLSCLQLFLCNYSIISMLWVYVFCFVWLPFAYTHTHKRLTMVMIRLLHSSSNFSSL